MSFLTIYNLFIIGLVGYALAGSIKQSAAKKSLKQSKHEGMENVQNGKDFANDCLKATNAYRAKHQAPPLKLNKTLSKFSQEWADHLSDTGTFEHRPDNPYGENIFNAAGSDPNYTVNCKEAIDSWYSEVDDYTYGDGFSMETGHFTQLVWINSKQLGVGYAHKDGQNYVVCNYDPPGNYEGEFEENVKPPK